MPDAQLIPARDAQVVRVQDFMPLFSVEQAVERKDQINEFIAKVMRENEDYGKMPGGQQKKVLMKPGAEKLCSIFGLSPRYEAECETEDWTGRDHNAEPFFYYRYRCQLYRGDRFMGEAVGSCNSWEQKYRYRWVSEDQLPADADKAALPSRGGRKTLFEFMFAFDKRETTGQYGKPEEHWQMFEKAIADGRARKSTRTTKKGDQVGWEIEVDMTMYRIPNPDSADTVNTCQKMAQKRALVAAVLVVTNCSDAFTQDLEDQEEQRNTPAQQAELAEKRIAEEHEKTANGKPGALKALLAMTPQQAFEALSEQADHIGGKGVAAYDKVQRAFEAKYPKGTNNREHLAQFISDCYYALDAAKKEEESGVVPEVVGGEK